MHAGASEFDQLGADWLERTEVEFLLTVVAAIYSRGGAGLQPIRANDLAAGQMLNEQVVADFVERIRIEAGRKRLRQALLEFEVEDGETQCLGSADIIRVSRKTGRVMGVGIDQQSGGCKLRQHSNPIFSYRSLFRMTVLRIDGRWMATRQISRQ